MASSTQDVSQSKSNSAESPVDESLLSSDRIIDHGQQGELQDVPVDSGKGTATAMDWPGISQLGTYQDHALGHQSSSWHDLHSALHQDINDRYRGATGEDTGGDLPPVDNYTYLNTEDSLLWDFSQADASYLADPRWTLLNSNDMSSSSNHESSNNLPQSNSLSPQISLYRENSNASSWDRIPEFDLGLQSDESQTLLVVQGSISDSEKHQSLAKSSEDIASHLDKDRERTDQSKSLKRKRRGFDSSELEKINTVRQESACIRCQMLKESCGAGCPCPRCLDINATATIWRAPCFKGRITDVQLFRGKALSFPNGVRRIEAWESPRKLRITLYNVGYSGRVMPPSQRPTISVVCQQFSPLKDDVLFKKYVRGDDTISIILPAFAIPQNFLVKTAKQLRNCVDKNWDMLANELELGQDELIATALQEAIRCHEQFPLVHEALTLCIMTRLLSKSFNLTGKETLSIPEVDDPVSPYFGRRPIPPLLDAQIDQLWMQIMKKIKKNLLSELKRKIMGRRKEDWYQNFLTLLILIANLEFVYAVQNDQLNRYCLKVCHPSMKGWL